MLHRSLIYVNASLIRSHGRKGRLLINKLIDATLRRKRNGSTRDRASADKADAS